MMMRMHPFISLSLFLVTLLHLGGARYEDRYNLARLPYDLRPIRNMIGMWQLERTLGQYHDLPPPSLLDYAINPIPKFGARAVNITHSYFDSTQHVVKSDYGFMPVKNATRRDPRIHIAYLTTSSEGWSMMEQGAVQGPRVNFHLKQFLRRSFDVGHGGNNVDIKEFERQFEQPDMDHLVMMVRAETARGLTEAFTAHYRRIL